MMSPRMQSLGAVIISTVVVTGYLAICLLLLFKQVADSPLLEQTYGGLQTAFAGVVFYWVGSSSGSRAKDVALANKDAQISSLIANTATVESK